MTTDEIFEKAYAERIKWRSRGITNGKYILGINARAKLMLSTHHNTGRITVNSLMGYPYVIDYDDLFAIHFCPIET